MDLVSFEGVWRLEKQITDRRAGAQMQFAGQAQWVRRATDWLYREEGVLRGPQGAMAASQSYLWDQDAGQAVVRFKDGRFFHSFDLGAAEPAARHHCDPDIYDVTYDFARWPAWSCVWRVEGPRKHYEMTCWYARGGEGTCASRPHWAEPQASLEEERTPK